MADTIFALATGIGKSAIAIIRLSGPQAKAALIRLSGVRNWPARVTKRVRLRDPENGDGLDDAMAVYFAAPASYTGEDVVELYLHGGRGVIKGVLMVLSRLTDLRGAEPGEFTRRAFLNGKIDLVEAEAVADLIDAETAMQRRSALHQLDGGLSAVCETWRNRLIDVLALTEAQIDFGDEDLPDDLEQRTETAIAGLADEIDTALVAGDRGERLRDGAVVVIVGAPNAGKSSLLNKLAGRDAAIVSPIAGTTRDAIEVQLELDGFPVTVVDTAGLRETKDPIETEGKRRALARAEHADVTLALFDATAWPEMDGETVAAMRDDTIIALNKSDVCWIDSGEVHGRKPIVISAKTGDGIDALEALLRKRVRACLEGGERAVMTRARHRTGLTACSAALHRAAAALSPELRAEDLRLAAQALGRISGRIDVEDLLDVIFREFCIGK